MYESMVSSGNPTRTKRYENTGFRNKSPKQASKEEN
jgi:hypothetical protein